MVKEIASVWLPVTQLDRAIGFYRDTLGLEVADHDGDWAEVDANGFKIGLNASEEDGAGVSGGPVIAFKAEDGIEAAADELRAKGIELSGEVSEHPWGKVATFKDSEGNDLQLYEAPQN
jgi:predicted enzyme related to lactoylglutathione lyase